MKGSGPSVRSRRRSFVRWAGYSRPTPYKAKRQRERQRVGRQARL